jgi:hypothetical protein
VEEGFDETALPFDANANATNRYFADLAKTNHENQRLMNQLRQRLDGFEGKDRQRTESQIRETWKSTATAAAAHIKDEGVRAMFKDAIALAFKDPDIRRQYTAQQLVGHYLKQLKVNPVGSGQGRDRGGRRRPEDGRADAGHAAAHR